MIIYGKQPVYYLIEKHPHKVKTLFVSKELDKKEYSRLMRMDFELKRIPENAAQSMSKTGNHQGFLAEVDELDLYEQVYASLTIDIPTPDLVVYLQAPVEVLLERIQKRGLKHERFIEAAYLQRLCDSYIQFFYQYNSAPLLIVNAADIDFANNDEDYQLLHQQITEVQSGRHYFNPTQVAL